MSSWVVWSATPVLRPGVLKKGEVDASTEGILSLNIPAIVLWEVYLVLTLAFKLAIFK